MSTSNVLHVPRETNEFQTLEVLYDGTPVTTGLSYALTPGDARPTSWTPMETLEGKTGFTINNMAPGSYRIWVQHADDTAAVRFAGILKVE